MSNHLMKPLIFFFFFSEIKGAKLQINKWKEIVKIRAVIEVYTEEKHRESLKE